MKRQERSDDGDGGEGGGGRDRGSSGQQRRDVRVYLGSDWGGGGLPLGVGTTVELNDDQNHYLSNLPRSR